jgi:hypothetical protein
MLLSQALVSIGWVARDLFLTAMAIWRNGREIYYLEIIEIIKGEIILNEPKLYSVLSGDGRGTFAI